MIDLAMLGVGGGMPLPGRYLSATLLNFKGRKILIDCGEGTQVSMRELGWGFKAIDIICITHPHGDHIVGLPGLLSTIGNSGRLTPLTIIGGPGIKDIIKGLTVICPYLPYELIVIEANSSSFTFKVQDDNLTPLNDLSTTELFETLEISTLPLDHSISCIGYSFKVKRAPIFDIKKAINNNIPKNLWGKLQKGETIIDNNKTYSPDMVLGDARRGLKLSYVTDSRPIESIIPFIEESDLFVCEGTYGDDADFEKAILNKHMTFREAATLAKSANVFELLLTHFSPAMPNPNLFLGNAKEVFSNTTIGETHLIKKLVFK